MSMLDAFVRWRAAGATSRAATSTMCAYLIDMRTMSH